MSEKCSSCQSANIKRQTGDAEPTIHYGRIYCGDCGRWLRWIRDPSNVIGQAVRPKIVDDLLTNFSGDLRSKDIEFLKSIRDVQKITPKQKGYLDGLYHQYLSQTKTPHREG